MAANKLSARKAQPSVEDGHSIRVVSELTRLPMGTLRAWERRYGFPKPERRESSNRRRYTAEQLERLRLIARLLEVGYRPSDVIHKPAHELLSLFSTGASSAREVTGAA